MAAVIFLSEFVYLEAPHAVPAAFRLEYLFTQSILGSSVFKAEKRGRSWKTKSSPAKSRPAYSDISDIYNRTILRSSKRVQVG